jgi:primosomal protein N' (replication factor Y) (superfamily II helicase)
VTLPVKETFSYSVPDSHTGLDMVGYRVTVPFGRRKATGYVLGQEPIDPHQPLRPVLEVEDDSVFFQAGMVPFLLWVADYYRHPIGLLIHSVVPGGGRSRPYFSARLTGRGRSLLGELPSSSTEHRLMAWIGANPGRRSPFPLQDIRKLEHKGLVSIEDRPSRKDPKGSRVKRFVRPLEGVDFESLLERRSEPARARNESSFLREVFCAGGLPLSEIRGKYSNGSYLVQKWVRKGVLMTCDVPVLKNTVGCEIFSSAEPVALFTQQDLALKRIQALLEKGEFASCLLHGVTGSGKTEVYYRAALAAIALGRQALVLVPEISLSVYMQDLFHSRLGDRVALYHSELSKAERREQWVRIARGDVDVVIGARSALFAPLSNPGLIVVDEEHDFSYKQEESPRYHARDAAVVRGKVENAVVLLGSGTPSIQSYYNALTGKYIMLGMPRRIESRPMPVVELVDMKQAEQDGGSGGGVLSQAMLEAVEKNLARGNQTLLFLNRRGFHRVCLCRRCGEAVRCPNCDLTLVHHLRDDTLACHYCGFRMRPEEHCRACGKGKIRALGFGTERLENELRRLLPEAEIDRMDRDSTRRKGEASRLLKRFGAGEIDILVGTQMITKGYDFPKVTLVGVIAADASLGFPDFRAAERTFQLLCQVAGRAGRGKLPGRVLVQSYAPGHYAVSTAGLYDYESFYRQEAELRSQLGYPPFSHLVRLLIQATSCEAAEVVARRLGRGMEEIRQSPGNEESGIRILGPVEAPIARIKGRYRRQILIKGKRVETLHRFLGRVEDLIHRLTRGTSAKVLLDVDPYHMQ